MPIQFPSSPPNEDPVEFDAAKAKEERARDAEKIRQDFIKSQHLPSGAPTAQKPPPESTEDEY